MCTIFPHCPFCKAAGDVPRWKSANPAELYPCKVCGIRYVPAEAAGREKFEMGLRDLRQLIGQSQFEVLAAKYLMDRGIGVAAAKEIVRA